MKATYGLDIESTQNEYVMKAEQAVRMAAGDDAPGANLIDLIPVCKWHISSRVSHWLNTSMKCGTSHGSSAPTSIVESREEEH